MMKQGLVYHLSHKEVDRVSRPVHAGCQCLGRILARAQGWPLLASEIAGCPQVRDSDPNGDRRPALSSARAALLCATVG
jgi:hypothetical protein